MSPRHSCILGACLLLSLSPGGTAWAQAEAVLPNAESVKDTASGPDTAGFKADSIIAAPSDTGSAPAAPAPQAAKADSVYETLELNPMVVIGKKPARFKKHPGTATRLDSLTLRRLQPIGTQEALATVPGVQVMADDGFGNSRINIGIRGLNPRRSSRVLVLEDGIPIQPALYLYPNAYYNPPTERIDEIEIIKGSAAIEYGPQTMGGVVNYITRRPRKAPGGEVRLLGGTHALAGLYGELGGWGPDWAKPEIQLLYKRGDGYRRNNGFEQYNATLKLNIAPTPDDVLYLKLNGNYEMTEATYTGLTEYSFKENPDFNPKEHDTFEVTRYALDLIHTHYYGDRGVRHTKAYGSIFLRDWWREDDVFARAADYESGTWSPVPYYTPGDLVRVGGGQANQGNLRDFYTLGLEQSYEWIHEIFSLKGTLKAGGRVHWERFVDDKKKGFSPDARDGLFYTGDPAVPESVAIVGQSHHFETMALALFAAENVELGRLTLKPGLRFEIFEQERIDLLNDAQYRDKTSYVFLPGLGLNYGLGKVNLFAGVHRGYTPPSSGSFQAIGFDAAASGGLDLKPEQSWNSELGFRADIPGLSVEVCGFHVLVEDLVAAGRGTLFKNLGTVQTYGVEAGGGLKASKWLPFLPDFLLAYTYLGSEILDAKITSYRPGNIVVDIAGNRLPYSPEHTLMAGLSRDFGFGLSLSASMRYESWVYTDFENLSFESNRGDTGPVPSHATFDATASYRLGRFRVYAAAKNLLDEKYMGSRLHSYPGQPEAHLSSGILPGPRREITAGTAVSF